MIALQLLYILTEERAHQGVRGPNGRLWADESCNLDDVPERDVIEADPDGERLAAISGRYTLCERCFPPATPLDPEAALMDAAAHESEP
jgi:hypothetical protein